MGKFKFDVAIGNPPYQEEAPGESTSDKPIYHLFMDAAYQAADIVELITPGRFLFNGGATPKPWNQKMLSDEHLKVLSYEPDASKVFPSTSFMGGVAVTYRDENKSYKPIRIFVQWNELRSICEKVEHDNFTGLDTIISGRTPYLFTDEFHKENPTAKSLMSAGHQYDISSNAFKTLTDIFVETPLEKNLCYRVLGRYGNERAYRWILKKYVRGRDASFIGKWKVFLPKANGASGQLGETAARLISKPEIGRPDDIATDTFIVVGSYDDEQSATALLKYIKGKFARALLGALKVTQDNTSNTWSKVPLQDFSSSSDIDWTKTSHEIDVQLYKKYGLSEDEINFIETKVKEMA